jgi:hypothetical protein
MVERGGGFPDQHQNPEAQFLEKRNSLDVGIVTKWSDK